VRLPLRARPHEDPRRRRRPGPAVAGGVRARAGGFVVVKAVDVGTALAAFAAESPDLAILDINLPGGSGFDICEAIRRQSRIR